MSGAVSDVVEAKKYAQQHKLQVLFETLAAKVLQERPEDPLKMIAELVAKERGTVVAEGTQETAKPAAQPHPPPTRTSSVKITEDSPGGAASRGSSSAQSLGSNSKKSEGADDEEPSPAASGDAKPISAVKFVCVLGADESARSAAATTAAAASGGVVVTASTLLPEGAADATSITPGESADLLRKATDKHGLEKCLVLSGFPCTIAQAVALDDAGFRPTAVVHLVSDAETDSAKRLTSLFVTAEYYRAREVCHDVAATGAPDALSHLFEKLFPGAGTSKNAAPPTPNNEAHK